MFCKEQGRRQRRLEILASTAHTRSVPLLDSKRTCGPKLRRLESRAWTITYYDKTTVWIIDMTRATSAHMKCHARTAPLSALLTSCDVTLLRGPCRQLPC
ncbi:hypothetical protein HYQ45_017663 [Verticillium longisporum]|uniref:Uncharacterized protein n=1 Tax=Verticillium longisporum TaxID=100787 RepID=A0A8I2Z4G7_VERLO|nr:hypothetical protein HYQ45_017663 [Verticillium longisporum]